ncbi:MAG: glucodextranase DOMON-like domain-containing protein [Candidatus Thalassarchaeaceae archaeon]|nr:glucodextranase DOMON-like domain-containing protein [Candidatus Thalassarchaeaceae archaeon]
MRRGAILIAVLFLAPAWLSLVTATIPDEITVDGDLSDWPSDTLSSIDSNSVNFQMTWNSTNLFFAWSGTDWESESEGADLFIYLNTSFGGSPLSRNWNLAQTLPFAADFAFVLEDASYFSIQFYDGSAWVESSIIPDAYVGWSGNQITEFSIPWSDIGSPENIGVIAWSQWQDEGNVWTSFPQENPASENGAETFTHWYQIENRSTSQSSADVEVLTSNTPLEKVDDALNLAIVFHQHQPYYKNKLTGMVEMPWVRVHAMTEYVDSPGILSGTDTKVTYNLVPSFIEQLLDYSENGVLDVHTDIARRSWNTGGYPNATALELHTMQFQSFWNSGWIYNVSSDDSRVGWVYPSSQRYSELHGMTLHNLKPATIMDDTLLSPQDFLDLQVLWYLYQFSPSYVQGDYNSSHLDQGLIDLFMQNGQYTLTDLTYVLDAQENHMSNILPMYSELATSGQIELTTTPYYHPIMPLLMMDGWTFEDGIRVNKDSWPEDVTNHLQTGMDLFEQELGFRPVGMWPSEQSVSPDMVQPVADVGIEWMVTDEINLEESTDMSGQTIDVSVASNLATPWMVGDVATIFRDRVISDRIAFQYGSMTPEAAVSDFLAYCDNIRQQLLDEGKDPSEHLLTVALDGENWMFMSEFQHQDNGRPFTEEWFGRLSTHPTVVTTTPGEFLEMNLTLPEIDVIGTGSWIDGTLSTWAGEAEESLAWQRTVEARQALVAFEVENPNHSGLMDAWESLYIAEGSDWYWWYGLDQDSGYDEMWDVLFKVHLSNIYRAVNLDLPPYLQDLWTNPALPDEPYGGVIEPMIDGIALPGEWDGAALYNATNTGDVLDIESFHLGYDASNVYVRVDMGSTPADWELMDMDAMPDLSIYFMQPNAINFNEVETNYRTYYGNSVLGFPAKHMISFNFDQLREDGQSKYDIFEAGGMVGDNEQWIFSGQSVLGGCAADNVYEFQIPWSEIGLAPRYSTRVKVVTAWHNTTDYGDGTDFEIAPPAPAEMILPDLEEWVTLLDFNETIGDENGKGDITYPTASDFSPGEGLFDITQLKVSQSSWNARFELTFAEMTDYWSLANGFSHQIVQIYVDQGDYLWGETDMLEGANAIIHEDWAWEVAISATGEPGAVKSINALSGETSSKGIEVNGDVSTKTITITVSKSIIGSDIPDYRFVIVSGSQDGFGPGKWRDVDADAKVWRLGGGEDPSDVDGIDYDPNVLDIVFDGDQNTMLGGYDVNSQQFAVLTGIELPDVAQQVFGVSVSSVTSSSAIIEWSTTKSANGTITCGGENFTTSEASLSHAIQVADLDPGSTYNCSILVMDASLVTISFNTTNEVDTTPPDILNLAVEIIDSSSLRVTWYTSEDATESVEVVDQNFLGDTLALRKNHEMTITLNPNLVALENYTLTVTVSDASGNTNTSNVNFIIQEEDVSNPPSDGDDLDSNGDSEDQQGNDGKGISELIEDPVVQIALLGVIIAVIFAFIRTRKNELDYFSFGAEETLFDETSDERD